MFHKLHYHHVDGKKEAHQIGSESKKGTDSDAGRKAIHNQNSRIMWIFEAFTNFSYYLTNFIVDYCTFCYTAFLYYV